MFGAHRPRTLVLWLSVGLLAAACGRSANSPASSPSPTVTRASTAKSPPLIQGFYNGRSVTYLLTDVSTESDAKALSKATRFPVSFVPRLGRVPESSLARLYLFMNGVEGPNPFGFQANVVDSIPGDAAYSPLWRVYAVKWNDASNARALKSAQAIHDAEMVTHEITITKTDLVKNSPVVTREPPLIPGFYDGKSITYLLTDVSVQKDAEDLSKATQFPVSFVPQLGRVPESSLARLYLFMNGVKGPNPLGFQANVVDSIPGEAVYSPLWRVYAVTWKDPSKARLLSSAQDIHDAEMVTHEITIEKTALVKNSPVVGTPAP
jgi:predicted metal-binding protein